MFGKRGMDIGKQRVLRPVPIPLNDNLFGSRSGVRDKECTRLTDIGRFLFHRGITVKR